MGSIGLSPWTTNPATGTYEQKGPAQIFPSPPVGGYETFSDIEKDWVFFRVPVGESSGLQMQGPKFWGPWTSGGLYTSPAPTTNPTASDVLHQSNEMNTPIPAARNILFNPSWRVMTHTGRVIGYSINYIRGDDVRPYLALNPSGGLPARLDEYPLVVPFIIQGKQALVDPSTGLGPALPSASQIYKAAGNLFQPYTRPAAGPPELGNAFGAHEWFKEDYQKHMTFGPGDLLTVGACKFFEDSNIYQNCQVTVYIEHFDA